MGIKPEIDVEDAEDRRKAERVEAKAAREAARQVELDEAEEARTAKGVLWEDKKRIGFFGLPWTFTKYTLTNDKIRIESGFLSRRHDEVRLYRVLDVSMSETLGQRIFGLGTLHLKTSDKTLHDFEMLNIKNPMKVYDLISEVAENERERKGVGMSEYIGVGPGARPGSEAEFDRCEDEIDRKAKGKKK